MTIPEAVSLVMLAGTYAKGGEIFVLDMGSPVKIATLARNLIKMAGYKPDVDIKIEYSGLRPGEKLYEEKLMAEEGLKKTKNKLIHIGCPIPFDIDVFLSKLEDLMDAYILDLSKKELSRLARLGSGSATRSVYGGFVEWKKGFDDESSYAAPIDENPDLDLSLLAIEVNTKQKKISSTKGMQLAQTSPFYQPWLARNEEEIAEIKQAIQNNDFTRIGELSELSANEMHACNLTAKEPFTYFEPETIKIIKLVEDLRKNGIECYYTIDAGPNVKILCTLRNRKDIISAVQKTLTNVKIVVASFGPGVTLL